MEWKLKYNGFILHGILSSVFLICVLITIFNFNYISIIFSIIYGFLEMYMLFGAIFNFIKKKEVSGLDKKEYKKFIRKIRRFAKGKGRFPTTIIENSPGDFTFISHDLNIKKTPLPELTIEQKQIIKDFIEKIKRSE